MSVDRGGTPTVIVARRARPGREREFERWLRRLVARAHDAVGYVDAEVQAPNEVHPDQWTVVYQFTDGESLQAWLRSPTRAALLADGNALVDGAAREQVVATGTHSEPVRAVSSARIPPAAMPAYRALHADVMRTLATFPGFLRSDLYEPVEGVQDDTIVVLVFDDRANLDRWLTSDARRRLLEPLDALAEGPRTVNVVGGFGGWFSPAGASDSRPKRWKQAVAVLLALVPTTLLYSALRTALFPDLHPVASVVIGNVLGVAALTWLLMPIITRRLDGWLGR